MTRWGRASCPSSIDRRDACPTNLRPNSVCLRQIPIKQILWQLLYAASLARAYTPEVCQGAEFCAPLTVSRVPSAVQLG
jgi:hypothetical protein